MARKYNNAPTKDEFGRPLGYRDGNRWIWNPTSAPYRLKRLTLQGTRGSLTPYTTGTFLKPKAGPRGGKGYQVCYRQVWFVNGLFCRVAKFKDEVEGWYRYFEPITGEVWNRYDKSEEHYELRGGVLV